MPGEREASRRLQELEPRLGRVHPAQPRGLDARGERHRAARLHLDPAVRTDEHDQQRGGGGAAHKMRFAQDLALFNLDLSEADIDFDGAAHRDVWQNAPEWQPTRQAVEELTAVGDWVSCSSRRTSSSSSSSASCSGVSSSCRSPPATATTSRRRSSARERTTTPVTFGSRAASSSCSCATRSTARPTRSSSASGCPCGSRVPRRRAGAPADLVAAGREADHFRDVAGRAKDKFRSLLEDLGLDIPKELDQ